MKYLLIPSRHILYSKEQEKIIKDVIDSGIYETVIFAITSSNLNNCKYSPIDLVGRVSMINKLAGDLMYGKSIPYTICTIPHYNQKVGFADYILKHCKYEIGLELTSTNTDVLALGAFLAESFKFIGFNTIYSPATDHVLLFNKLFVDNDSEFFLEHLSDSSKYIFHNQKNLLDRAGLIWNDPILKDTGGITESRNYHTYSYDMSNDSMLQVKYKDIETHIREGKILDDGCADAALFIPISKNFPDSDLIGVDISEEFIARAKERVRAGFFGGSFVSIIQGNILNPILKHESTDTVICNSTMHEIWSYNDKQESVAKYLKLKYNQLRGGGRIVIRDVIGPQDKHKIVYICDLEDADKFEKFFNEFKHIGENDEMFKFEYKGNLMYKTNLKLATEYMLHKDYLENWDSEMQEEFCHYNLRDWNNLLIDSGYKVVNLMSYRSDWILEHRLKGKILLLDENFKALEFPDTNCVVVGEK